MNNTATKYIVLTLALCAVATGCANSRKSASSNVPAMNVAAMDVPAPAAPTAQYTPQQPVTYDAPQSAAAEEPSDSIASAADDIAPSRPAPARSRSVSGTKYKVKKGESLWSIAQAKYGNGAKWKTIAAANPSMNPNKIQAGQTIVLP